MKPSRRNFIKGIGLGAVASGFARVVQARSVTNKPNFIFILADDLGYGDLGCYGQKLIQTPMIDKLSTKSMTFSHFYSGYTVCLPSRGALMTGLHTGHGRCRINGSQGFHPDQLTAEDTTIATMLKTVGYKTAMIGKWSLGDHFNGCDVKKQNKDGAGAVYNQGWDFYYGEPNQSYNHEYYPNVLYRYDRYGMVGKKTPAKEMVPERFPNNRKNHKVYSHDKLTENALAFIDAAKDDPFFLYLPYAIPHPQYKIPELEPYAEKTDWTEKEKVYASMITRMDRDVGTIVKRVEQLGIAKNTFIIFTSDNGPNKAIKSLFDSTGGLPGAKQTLEDGGLRVPFIAYWPGTIKPNTKSDLLAAFWDMMPTYAQLAGIKAPAPLDGHSIVPTLLGKGTQAQHDYLYFTPNRGSDPRIVRGKGETRSDQEILKEADTAVVVPVFNP